MDNTVRDSAGAPGVAGGAVATEVSLSDSVSSVDVVTVCAVTVDFGLDLSASSSFVDDVDELVLEVSSSSDAGSSSSFSLAADDELRMADELDDGAEFAPADSEFDDEDSDDDDSEELDWPSSANADPRQRPSVKSRRARVSTTGKRAIVKILQSGRLGTPSP